MKVSDFIDLPIRIVQDYDFCIVSQLQRKGVGKLVWINSDEDLSIIIQDPMIHVIILKPRNNIPSLYEKGVVFSEKPVTVALYILSRLLETSHCSVEKKKTIIDPTVKIHSTSRIAENNVIIGKNSEIGEHTIIHENTYIGRSVLIGANCQIGILPKIDEILPKELTFFGSTEIEDNVEIHSNCIIERPFIHEKTIINSNSKIDNLVCIREGVSIGERTLITANSDIGAYAIIGQDCWIGLKSKIYPGIEIGESCYITLGSRVSKNILSNMLVKDNWAVNKEKFKHLIS